MSPLRRKMLQAAGFAGLGLAGYSFYRGVRLPTLHWDPLALSNQFSLNSFAAATGTGLIKTSDQERWDASFRAYRPEPRMSLNFTRTASLNIRVNNIAEDARLQLHTHIEQVQERSQGINRILTISANAGENVDLSWVLPELGEYKFAAIGDSGGDQELAWCIQRAADLGARFLLHLGDFNYQDGDYQRAIDLFYSSPIPIYVSIGNHDFHQSGGIYGTFLQEIGPLNSTFTIGQTRFVNFDTAANILPYFAGERGRMFKQLARHPEPSDTVAFTHRPLIDPLHDSDHDIGSEGERNWILESLRAINADTLLAGHLHIFDRRDYQGIDHIIAGQGLGHQDLIVNDINYSKMIIGHVDGGGKVSYTAEPLAMPMAMHCHPRSDPVKDEQMNAPHRRVIEEIQQACKN